jgi:hypothetical protein
MTRWIAGAVLLLTGCATSFTGDAKVPHGVAGCRAKCEAWGLEFIGMVAMGEYSDGCICREKGKALSLVDVNGGVAAAAGVAMQVRRAQQQQMMHGAR